LVGGVLAVSEGKLVEESRLGKPLRAK